VSRNLNLIKKLLKAGADPNFKKEGMITTPLWDAVSNDDTLDIVECLLEAKADVNAPGYDGRLPLLSTRDPIVFTKLVEAGTNLYVQSKDGYTAIEAASSYGPDSLKMVLDKLTTLKMEVGIYKNEEDIKPITKQDLAAIWRMRVVLAGGENSLKAQTYLKTVKMGNSEVIILLENYLNIDFLERLAEEKINLKEFKKEIAM
jgi:ankyrin repeat protein